MKTVEVAVEHVLAGLLALCAFALPLFSGHRLDLEELGTFPIFGMLGVAYLFGVVFDRVVDTVLAPFEQYHRLKIAVKEMDGAKEEAKEEKPDYFPQDRLEFQLRFRNQGVLDWMSSLRSRLRTARALAVLGLPAVLGAAIYLGHLTESKLESSPGSYLFDGSGGTTGLGSWIPVGAVALGLALLGAALLRQWQEWFELPRTNELPTDQEEAEKELRKKRKTLCAASSPFALLWMSSLGTLLVIADSLRAPSLWRTGGLAAAVVSLFAFWAWWRIGDTYMNFVKQAEQLPEIATTHDQD